MSKHPGQVTWPYPIGQAKTWWNPTLHSTWLQIEKTVLVTQPKLVLSALLLQHHGTYSYLSNINLTIKKWQAVYQHTTGILCHWLPFISLNALHIIIPDTVYHCRNGMLLALAPLEICFKAPYYSPSNDYKLNIISPIKNIFNYIRLRSALSHMQWSD